MANPPANLSDSPPKDTKPVHWLVRVIRLTLIGILLYFGWTTYLSYREMLSDDQDRQEEIDPDDAVRLIPELLMSQPEAGSWVLAGIPLQVSSATTDEAKLKNFLQPPSNIEKAQKFWPLDHNFRVFLGLFRRQALSEGKGFVYHAEGKEQKMVLFSRVDMGTEYLVGGALARKSGKLWTVLRGSPNELSAAPSAGHRLLPLTPGTKLLAERLGEKNQTLAQVLLFEGRMPQARTYWQERGWSIRKVKGWEEGQLIVCYKEGVSVSVLAMPGARAEDPTTLLLVRLPEPRGSRVKNRE